MDFLNFINLLGITFDLVAWPIITLVYPLYASIRAIENNSHVENRKLLIYWILCGLIMLFEFLSASFIEWFPLWTQIKLMGTFWFVIPHFGGAVYAYDHFVRPCIFANTNWFCNWLRPREDLRRGDSDDFLLLAERYVQEKGSQGLEKLLYGKVKCVEPNPTAETNSVSSLSSGEAEARDAIELTKPSLSQANSAATKVDKMTTTIGMGSELPQSSTHEGTKEWNCDLCQVSTRSEAAMYDHFQGKLHKTKGMELMGSTLVQTNYDEASAAENKVKRVEEVSQGPKVPESSIPDKVQKEWTCVLCQVCTQSEGVLLNHFQGRKHRARERELLAKQTAAKNKTTSASNAKVTTDKPNMTTKGGVSADVSNVKYVKRPEEKRTAGSGTGDRQAKTKQNNTKIEIPSGTYIKKPGGTGTADQQAKTKQNKAKIEIPSGTCVKKPEENRAGDTGTGKTRRDTKIEIPEGTYVKEAEGKRVGGSGTGDRSASSNQSNQNALWCDPCKLQCNSLSMLTDHLCGRRHLASLGIQQNGLPKTQDAQQDKQQLTAPVTLRASPPLPSPNMISASPVTISSYIVSLHCWLSLPIKLEAGP